MMHKEARSSKTLVLHQYAGIGDLIWHIPYIRKIAETSLNGQVSVIASPTTHAKELLSVESCVDQVIEYYHHPRSIDKGMNKERGISRMMAMARELRTMGFEKIVLFSGRPSRGALAWLAHIPVREGYGYSFWQRIFLNAPPYIKAYRGESLAVYREATRFCMAHGYCSEPIVPKMTVPEDLIEVARRRYGHLARPLYAFGIGTSEPNKQWGAANYAALAAELVRRSCSVILLGGPREQEIAQQIVQGVPAELRGAVAVQVNGSVLESAATLKVVDACIGNDTGVPNMAVACDRPAFVVLGNRPAPDYDPLMRFIKSKSLGDISVREVLQTLENSGAPGFPGKIQ